MGVLVATGLWEWVGVAKGMRGERGALVVQPGRARLYGRGGPGHGEILSRAAPDEARH